jgi:eukaryotic-like serine/threonine-protein kinase
VTGTVSATATALDPAPSAPFVERIGPYRILREIGSGGMGSVFLATRDDDYKKRVALKVIKLGRDTDVIVRRFRNERQILATLDHPHIARLLDGGTTEQGLPYFVMDYVEGMPIDDFCAKRDLSVSERLALFRQVCSAVHYAHQNLVIHRDIKPGNILVTKEGAVRLLDFGIAKLTSPELSGVSIDAGATAAGFMTPQYASPEQVRGVVITTATDIYSLGIVLYEMLTGVVPFTGETPVAVAMKHVREDVPDVQLARPEVSAATASVVERATAKDLDQRYPDAASMVADLEEVLAIEASRTGQATGEVTTVLRTLPGTARRRLPWRMRHPVRWIVSLALLAAIVALALIIAADRTHRGVAPDVDARPGLQAVPLTQTAAHDYNPFGTGPENRENDQNAVDGDPNTSWSTEHYYDETLKKAGGTGVGLYVDAAPNVAAKQVEIQTPTPGFATQIYVANQIDLSLPYGNSTPLTARGWRGPVGEQPSVRDGAHIPITLGGKRYRYYLVWITKLPPGKQSASISELTLFS